MFLTVLGVATLPKKAAPRGVSLAGSNKRQGEDGHTRMFLRCRKGALGRW